MKLNDELDFLKKNIFSVEELKGYYKVAAMLNISADNYDNASVYLSELHNINNPIEGGSMPSSTTKVPDRKITADEVKTVIAKLNSSNRTQPLTVDEVINAIDSNLTGNQDLRNLVANVLANK
ncbi:hypothetical protein [Apilactobacillus timberlakei]|uniref:hypothetical protein n=1 Tax=Apilactobacillus timberlakei TaxID=2008380 RepID=UPI00112A0D16|nr:hypothetical protein [Apilactobacillus timberlakei]TPR12276.1 hypothetical protein DYZ97_07290 [Apilactobacillus timberlakei]